MKKISIIYIILCICCCILPFVGMTVARTDTTTENKTLVSMPELKSDDEFNIHYLSDLGNYFTEHFAFRNELVAVDSIVNARLLETSTADSVIVGKKGWLYYSSTLDDYLGKNLMTKQQIKAMANNLRLTQNYVEENGKIFLLIVPPNKNSLYGEYMPDNESYKISEEKNIDLLGKEIEDEGLDIAYLDLFTLFKEQDEILYYQRDSHWNNKGALLVYRALMDGLGLDYDDYEEVDTVLTNDYIGDLNSMLYPKGAIPEEQIMYEFTKNYKYMTPTKSVEEALIETSNEEKEGSLLMYRDSFGNSLLPFMANAFNRASFIKTIPYNLAMHIDTYDSDVVIIEKVERNLKEFYQDPPVFEGPDCTEDVLTEFSEDKAISNMNQLEVEVCEAQANTDYWEFTGALPDETDQVYLMFTDDETEDVFIEEAFTIITQEGKSAYRLYTDKYSLPETKVKADIIIKTNGKYEKFRGKEVDFSQILVTDAE